MKENIKFTQRDEVVKSPDVSGLNINGDKSIR